MNTEEMMQFVPERIKQQQVGDFFVSTIRIKRPTAFFETMVFDLNQEPVAADRTHTLAEALEIHAEAVQRFSGLDTSTNI